MKEDHISRPEFDLYVKMTAESNKKTSAAVESIARSHKEAIKESRETNQILREYIIHNNNKHDKTDERLTVQSNKIEALSHAVEANSNVTAFAKAVKKGLIIVLVGALTSIGGYYGLQAINKTPSEKVANQ